jgi:uncharacterized protein (DUF2225 family)
MQRKISFFSKKETRCPVCEESFYKEEMMTGGGRMIAGNLDDDLRRHYEPSKKFGEVFPLVYYMYTCPHCLYSAFPSDFSSVDEKVIPALEAATGDRKEYILSLFPNIEYAQPRGLIEGAASFILGAMSYEHFHKQSAPTFKQGLCALRAAWLFTDMHRKEPGENYDYLAKIFFHKAAYFYMRVIELETSGGESLANLSNHGPDLDKNYGYDGILYLAGYLEYRYGNHSVEELHKKSLQSARMAISRIVGMGKSSKSKPSILLDKARDLHKLIGQELKEEKDEEQEAL